MSKIPAAILIHEQPIEIFEKVPLAPLTTLKVGGPARYFVTARTEEQLLAAFVHAEAHDLDVFVLGGGSNILVSDSGFDGLVVHIALRKIEARTAGGKVQITAAAGEDWDEFVRFCVDKNLAGVECLSGIPGLVGGTPIQNVGAYGQEVSETITTVRCFDRRSKKAIELSNEDCGFAYRTSIFNSTDVGRYVVLSVTFELKHNGKPKLTYKDLHSQFGDREPTLTQVRNAVLDIRRSKSMVIDENDPNSRSAGSFFKNPLIEKFDLLRIASAAGVAAAPNFPVDEKRAKVPAAWLIERAGFHKGFRLGNAGISANHSLALINLGTATAADVIALKNAVQEGVEQKFGIRLVPEPIFVGFGDAAETQKSSNSTFI